MTKLELVLIARKLQNEVDDMVTFHDESIIITMHYRGDDLSLSVHGMDGLSVIGMILDNDVFVAEDFTPTEEQQKVIDRVNEIMKEEV